MLQPGRKFNAGSSYRYGFNGKENDNEVKGEGNQQDYGMRIYDPRLGRFLSVDPLIKSYPWYTPYQFAGNKPIVAVDIDGLEEYIVIERLYHDGAKSITIEYVTKKGTNDAVNLHYREVMNNGNGKMQLGTRWTDENVIRIVQDEQGNDISVKPGKSLSAEELDIIKKSTKASFGSTEQNVWTINAKGIGYDSEVKRDLSEVDEKVAEKWIAGPVAEDYSYHTTRFGATSTSNSVDVAFDGTVAAVKKDVAKNEKDFNSKFSTNKAIQTTVTLTGLPQAKKRLQFAKDELNKQGIKVKIKINKNYKDKWTGPEHSDQNYKVEIKTKIN